MRLVIIALLFLTVGCSDRRRVLTVNGYVDADSLGFALPHEHVLVDFIGADSVGPHRYNQDSAFQVILPHLLELKESGGATVFECTPAYLGRDAVLLQRLATACRLNIIANTGYYGAAGEKYYPAHAFTESAEQIADRWIQEWKEGIDNTGIRPGFIKLGVDNGPVTDTQRKLAHAAAITHLATGMTIAIHCGDFKGASEELSVLQSRGVLPEAMIWVHAQNETAVPWHKTMAGDGVWVELDGLNDENVEQYVELLKLARAGSYLHRVLVSHDAGWYHVGEPKGGMYRGYNTLSSKLIPALQRENFSKAEIELITRTNPSQAYALWVRERLD